MMTRSAALIALGVLVAAQAAAQPIAVPFQSLFDGNALTGVAAIAATADGRHVYAAGNGDRAIAAFSRNPGNGRLGRVGVYRDGDDGFSGIDLTARFAFAPDEITLYAAGGDSIAVLHRDADSGELTPGPTVRGGFGINQLTDIAVAAAGDRLFAVGSSAVAMFAIDQSGALEHVATVTDGAQFPALAGASAVETAGNFVYVASEIDRAVSVLNAGATALTGVQTLQVADSDLLGGIADLAISSDGNQLYAAIADGDRVVVLQRDGADGRIAVDGAVSEAEPGRGLAAPRRLAISSDDQRVYVASATESSVALLDRDTATGALTAVRSAFDGAGGVNGIGGASDIALGPVQTHVYVSGADDAAIGLFDAALTFLAIERNSAGAISGMRQPAAIAVSPDGGHAYAAGFGSGAIAIFRRESNGALVFSGAYRGGGSRSLVQPISLTFTPDGSTLVVADFGAEAVQTLRRDPATGALAALGFLDSATVGDLRGVSSVAVSPDTGLVAATSLLSGSALLLTLNPSTGDLALRATMPALAQPSFAAFSGDGRNLYTTSSGNNAVVAFTSTAAGPFPELEVIRSRDGIQGLVSPASLALSPDGDNLYVASGGGLFAIDGSNAVAVFSRRASDGALTFRQALIDGEDIVEGILGATAVAVSPSGNLVAVAGFGGNSLGVFGRDTASGDLTFLEAQFDGSGGANGLGGASSVAFSPSGGELYVTGFADDAITSFRVPTPLPTATATATPTTPPTATATPIPITPAATATVTAPSTPTPDATAATPRCPGDCDDGDTVAIAELIRCVNIALGSAAVDTCSACDADGDGQVAINELIQAVSAALNGC